MLVLSMQAHLGPRILKAGLHSSELLAGYDSVEAGCGRAASFSRLILYELLDTAHNRWPDYAPSAHIDDLAQVGRGKEDEVAQGLGGSAEFLGTGLLELRQRISDKGSYSAQQF